MNVLNARAFESPYFYFVFLLGGVLTSSCQAFRNRIKNGIVGRREFGTGIATGFEISAYTKCKLSLASIEFGYNIVFEYTMHNTSS